MQSLAIIGNWAVGESAVLIAPGWVTRGADHRAGTGVFVALIVGSAWLFTVLRVGNPNGARPDKAVVMATEVSGCRCRNSFRLGLLLKLLKLDSSWCEALLLVVEPQLSMVKHLILIVLAHILMPILCNGNVTACITNATRYIGVMYGDLPLSRLTQADVNSLHWHWVNGLLSDYSCLFRDCSVGQWQG